MLSFETPMLVNLYLKSSYIVIKLSHVVNLLVLETARSRNGERKSFANCHLSSMNVAWATGKGKWCKKRFQIVGRSEESQSWLIIWRYLHTLSIQTRSIIIIGRQHKYKVLMGKLTIANHQLDYSGSNREVLLCGKCRDLLRG